MENVFKKGFILGGLLTVATAIGFVLSNVDTELTEDMQKDLKVLAKQLNKRLLKLEDVTKQEFHDLIMIVIEELGKEKELAMHTKKVLMHTLLEKWEEMEAHARLDKEAEKV